MYTFDEIVDNAFTSREEVEMISDAQIGAEHDIDVEAARIVSELSNILGYAAYSEYRVRKYPR